MFSFRLYMLYEININVGISMLIYMVFHPKIWYTLLICYHYSISNLKTSVFSIAMEQKLNKAKARWEIEGLAISL